MILVIGYGNPLSSDDGLGPYAVEQLAAQAEQRLADKVDYQIVYQLTPELAEPISRAECVIFVDAAYSAGETPGTLTCQILPPTAPPLRTTSAAFTHHLDAAALLESAQSLYGRRPVAYVYTVTGETFALGQTFSAAVESVLPTLIDHLKARLSQCTNLALPRTSFEDFSASLSGKVSPA
ncbi:MAG TPA: hydrogenase maturation protease [Aggregatilineales bacterium]|nr:hydrogenase maturation protease [Anaerolineales bacterium]HRE48235.1 hydrogenase maturation protease [Aggregatilineales bacterium]